MRRYHFSAQSPKNEFGVVLMLNGIDRMNFFKERFFNCTPEELRLGEVVQLLSLYKLLVVENERLKAELERYKRETSQLPNNQNVTTQPKK
jgi:hypothetical protein